MKASLEDTTMSIAATLAAFFLEAKSRKPRGTIRLAQQMPRLSSALSRCPQFVDSEQVFRIPQVLIGRGGQGCPQPLTGGPRARPRRVHKR